MHYTAQLFYRVSFVFDLEGLYSILMTHFPRPSARVLRRFCKKHMSRTGLLWEGSALAGKEWEGNAMCTITDTPISARLESAPLLPRLRLDERIDRWVDVPGFH